MKGRREEEMGRRKERVKERSEGQLEIYNKEMLLGKLSAMMIVMDVSGL